jgi:phthiocerol/phenolphthiocerol synthesis type-I polyketide synthase D
VTGRRARLTVTSRVGGAPARVHATLDVATETAAPQAIPAGSVTDLKPRTSSRGRWSGRPERIAAALDRPVSTVDSVRCYGDVATVTGVVARGDDLWFVDDSRAAVVELRGVAFTETQAGPVALQEKLFGIRWSPAPATAGSIVDTAVLVVGDGTDSRVADSVSALREAGATVRVARPVDTVKTLPDKVLCWIPAGKHVDEGPKALRAVGALVKELVGAGAEHTRLWLATSGAAALNENDTVDAVAGAIRATARVLGYEHPELTASWVDVLDPADVVAELAAGDAADEVAWRDGRRYAAKVCATDVPIAAGVPSVVRPDGAYVVTGGLGGIGLKMGRWLADAGAARIVLNGRSAPSENAAAEIEAMRAGGTDVLVECGDIAELATAQRLVAAAGENLRGIVHAAAVIDDKVTINVDAELIGRVWRPKAIGAWNLHVATEDSALDFWLGFSSVVSLLGYPGHPAYSYANSFVDGLVAHRRSLGLPGTAINWGSWAEVGQAADRGMSIRGMAPTDPVENVEAIEAVLRNGKTNIGVLRPIASELLELAEDLVDIPFFAELVGAATAQQSNDWAGVGAMLALPAEQARARMSERVQQKVAGIMGVPADGFDRHTALTSLGVDSLVAVRIRNSVQHDFDAVLPPTLLLRGANLSEVDGWLSERLLGERAASTNGVVLVPPRDAAERLMAAVCGAVLGHGVGMTQQLDELTGEENVVEEIAEQLTRRSGHVVTAAELREKRSVERMAELVREAEHPENPLRALRNGDGSAPLFVFHPAGGDTVVYRQLVDQLDPAIGVYGFDRLDGSSTVEERVAVYLPLLKEIQPEGPYRLGGWSFGGVLAYEMGRQLAAAGDEVELVAMVDTILPLPVPEDMTEVEVMELRFRRFSEFLQTSYGMRVELPYEQMAAASDERQVDLLIETIEATGLINSEVSPAIIRHQRTSYVDALALQRYKPANFPARVQLYSVTEAPDGGMRDPLFDRDDPAKGWDEIRGDDVEVISVPGHHLSVLDPPHVQVLGAELAAALGDHDRSMIH